MPKDKRGLIPKGMKRRIGKDVTITNVVKTTCGLKIVGKNPIQSFEELWGPKGKTKGMILRLKKQNFWSVWKGANVVTKAIKGTPGSVYVVGSNNKNGAWRLMLKEIGGCKRKR